MSCIFLQEDIEKLFLNKHVVVMGGSIQRSVYKDLVRLLQGNIYLKDKELRLKGEESMLSDKLTFKSQAINGAGYREEREYITDHHFLKFIFLTRCYNTYVESVLKKFEEAEIKPDVIIINSCLWDLTSYGAGGRNNASAIDEYKDNLDKMFTRFKETLPECLCIWNTNPPIAKDCKGGVFVPGTEDLKSSMGLHLLEANVYAQNLAINHGFDVIDLYYYLMHHVHRRAEDGIHWDMTAHRRVSNLILTHISEAWEVDLPKHVENTVIQKKCTENKTIQNQDKENKTKTVVQKVNKTKKKKKNKNNIGNIQPQTMYQQHANDNVDYHTRFMAGQISRNCLAPRADQSYNSEGIPSYIDGNSFPHSSAVPGPAGRRIARGAAIRRAIRFPRARGSLQRPLPPRSSSPSFPYMNEAYRNSHQYRHETDDNYTPTTSHDYPETASYDYHGRNDYDYDETDNYANSHDYHTEAESNEYHTESQYDANLNANYRPTDLYAYNANTDRNAYSYHADYNSEDWRTDEYYAPVENSHRNKYAEDIYASRVAENYYHSGQPSAQQADDRWTPYDQYPHRGKIHPVMRGPVGRYMPYTRRPPW